MSHATAPTPEPSALVRGFGKAIRRLRDARGWSQEKLAEASNLNRTYIGEIERGQVTASLTTVEKLACAFDLPVQALFAQATQRRQGPEPPPLGPHSPPLIF